LQVLLYRLLPHLPALGLDKQAMAADMEAIGVTYPRRLQLSTTEYLALLTVHALVHAALTLMLRTNFTPGTCDHSLE
jgi:hypothetical protein